MSLWHWFADRKALINKIEEMEHEVKWWKRAAEEDREEYNKARAESDLNEEYTKTRNALIAAEVEIADLKQVIVSQSQELEEARRAAH